MFRLKRKLLGYAHCRFLGESKARMINICRKHRIYLWDTAVLDGKEMTFYILKQDIKEAEKIAQTCGGTLSVLDVYGLPSVLKSMFAHKFFYIGGGICAALVIFMSRFIWNVEITGNSFYTDETLVQYLNEIRSGPGTPKASVVPSEVEEELRLKYPGITWVSARIVGTKLKIEMEEGIQPPETIQEEKAVITSDYDGMIISLMLRSGTALVRQGDEVSRGDILVEGKNDILNDDGTVKETKIVAADADIVIRTQMTVDRTYSRKYEKKNYTGEKKVSYLWQIAGWRLSLPEVGKTAETLYEETVTYKKFRLTPNFYLPFVSEKRIRTYYVTEEALYTEEEIKEIAQSDIQRQLDALTQSGAEILENQIEYQMFDDYLKVGGYVTADVPAGTQIQGI